MDHSRLHPKRIRSQHSPILGVYAYTPCHRTTKFDMVTRGGSVYLGVSHTSHPKEAELWLPDYWGSPVSCTVETTRFNEERPNLPL